MLTNSHQYDDVRSNGSKYGLGKYESRLNLNTQATSGTRSNHGGYNNSGLRGGENNLDNLIPQATLARLDKGLGAVASSRQSAAGIYSEAGSKSRNNNMAQKNFQTLDPVSRTSRLQQMGSGRSDNPLRIQRNEQVRDSPASLIGSIRQSSRGSKNGRLPQLSRQHASKENLEDYDGNVRLESNRQSNYMGNNSNSHRVLRQSSGNRSQARSQTQVQQEADNQPRSKINSILNELTTSIHHEEPIGRASDSKKDILSKILANEDSESSKKPQRFNYIPTKRASNIKKQEVTNREPTQEYSLDTKPQFVSADPVTTLHLYEKYKTADQPLGEPSSDLAAIFGTKFERTTDKTPDIKMSRPTPEKAEDPYHVPKIDSENKVDESSSKLDDMFARFGMKETAKQEVTKDLLQGVELKSNAKPYNNPFDSQTPKEPTDPLDILEQQLAAPKQNYEAQEPEEQVIKEPEEVKKPFVQGPLYILPPTNASGQPEFQKGALLKRHLSSFPQKSNDQELPLGLKVFLYQMHQQAEAVQAMREAQKQGKKKIDKKFNGIRIKATNQKAIDWHKKNSTMHQNEVYNEWQKGWLADKLKKVANKHINKEISAVTEKNGAKIAKNQQQNEMAGSLGGKVNDIGEVGKNPSASNNIRGDIMGIMKGQSQPVPKKGVQNQEEESSDDEEDSSDEESSSEDDEVEQVNAQSKQQTVTNQDNKAKPEAQASKDDPKGEEKANTGWGRFNPFNKKK